MNDEEQNLPTLNTAEFIAAMTKAADESGVPLYAIIDVKDANDKQVQGKPVAVFGYRMLADAVLPHIHASMTDFLAKAGIAHTLNLQVRELEGPAKNTTWLMRRFRGRRGFSAS